MPYKNPEDRDYKRQWELQKARGEHPAQMERQRARRALDAKGVDRSGKDVGHNKPLAKGGSNAQGYKLESRSANRSKNGHHPGEKK